MSAWPDKYAVKTTLQLKDDFKIDYFIETGTFRGVGIELYSHFFKNCWSCEINEEYYKLAKNRIDNAKINNVQLVLGDSSDFLHRINKINDEYSLSFNKPSVFFFLDAHFYDPKLPKEDMWVIKKELKALEGFGECIIAIHDFDCNNGIGHLIYDGQHCNWDLVKNELKNINPHFNYYCNTIETSQMFNEKDINKLPITINELVLDTVRFANSTEEKRHRGVLYAVPQKLNLLKYDLVEFKA